MRNSFRQSYRCLLFMSALTLTNMSYAADGNIPASVEPVDQAFVDAVAKALPTARQKPASARTLLVMTKTEGARHGSISNGCQALKQISEATKAFSVEFSDDLADFATESLARYDGVLLLSTTKLAPTTSQKEALLAFIEQQGKGLIGIHAASDNFYGWEEGQHLIGGTYKGHPWHSTDTSAIKIEDPQHPVVSAFGGKGLWLKDEIYQIGAPFDRAELRVLLSLDMSRPENARSDKSVAAANNDFPIAWIKTQGKGRVFYTCLGHNPEMYSTPMVLQHYLDGIQFALGDLPADTTPSTQLSPPPTPALAPPEAPPGAGSQFKPKSEKKKK